MTSLALLITTICLCISIHLTNKRISDLRDKLRKHEKETIFGISSLLRHITRLENTYIFEENFTPKKPGRKKKEAKN